MGFRQSPCRYEPVTVTALVGLRLISQTSAKQTS
jgi:hypothetical protein